MSKRLKVSQIETPNVRHKSLQLFYEFRFILGSFVHMPFDGVLFLSALFWISD
jgi:hypothetical protein